CGTDIGETEDPPPPAEATVGPKASAAASVAAAPTTAAPEVNGRQIGAVAAAHLKNWPTMPPATMPVTTFLTVCLGLSPTMVEPTTSLIPKNPLTAARP